MQRRYSALVVRHYMIPKRGDSLVTAKSFLKAAPGTTSFAPSSLFPCLDKASVTRKG